MEEWWCEDTDLAAFAREGPEVKTRGRLSANSAELIHLQQKDAICGYARDPRTFRMCPTIASDFRTMSANHERILDPGLMHALETEFNAEQRGALCDRDSRNICWIFLFHYKTLL